jgi:hypothetical protein
MSSAYFPSINSLTFRDYIKNLKSTIFNKDEELMKRLDASVRLLGSLKEFYRLPKYEHPDIIKTIIDIYLTNNIRSDAVLSHTKYEYENINYEISKRIYEEHKSPSPYNIEEFSLLTIAKVLIKYTEDNNFREQLYNELDNRYRRETDIQSKMRIADIFYQSDNTFWFNRGLIMLDEIRALENMNNNKVLLKTVYGDSQNVHNTSINESVKKVAINLIKEMTSDEIKEKLGTNQNIIKGINSFNSFDLNEVFEDIEEYLRKNNSDKLYYESKNINKALKRIFNDNSFYGFRLSQLFTSIWIYIHLHEHKDELKNRLVEELIAMHNYCSTGYFSRLVNTIQGFTDDPDLQIRISDSEQINSVIFMYLNKELSNAPENVQESMIEINYEGKKIFYQFICDIINKEKSKFEKEYGKDEINQYIINIIDKYTTTKNIFKLQDNLICF